MSKTYADIIAEVNQRKQQLAQKCADLFVDNTSATLEIGCGHGHFLAAYAQAHPETFCFGIDLVSKRIEKANLKKAKQNIENLHFLKAEVSEFLEGLPSAVVFQSIFMLFPDPWPKKRHHKNRMVQQGFLNTIAQHTKTDSKFYFRTDDTNYFEWTCQHVQDNPFWELDSTAQWPFEKESYFQNLMDSWQSCIARRIPITSC